MKKEIKAVSFTPKYDVLEDRVRISINYDDISNRVDFVMTRALVIKLFPILDEYMFKFYDESIGVHMPSPQIQENKPTVENQTSVTDGSDLQLYKQADELLVEVKFSFIKQTKKTNLSLISSSSVASTQLDGASMKHIFEIIKSTIPFFSWGISQNI